MSRYGQPINIFRRQGILSRIANHIPQPIKAFCAVTGLAAATVVIAPALIILLAPPLICGAWLWRRQIRSFQKVANELHNQRWRDLASFHLQSNTSRPTKAAVHHASKIPIYAQIAIEKSISHNEQNLAQILRVQSSSEISYGPLQLLSQDFRLDPSGFTENMSISEYPLLINGVYQGLVRVVTRGDQQSTKDLSRIEVQYKNQLVILNQRSDDENVIEGGGRPIK